MTRKVINIDGIEKVFQTDEEFLEYARIIYKENETLTDKVFGRSTIHWLPDNIKNAVEYIHEYCDNLTLIEDPMTPERRELYLKSPNTCPYCQNDNNLDVHEAQFEGSQIFQDVFCTCGRTWTDIYTLTDVSEN